MSVRPLLRQIGLAALLGLGSSSLWAQEIVVSAAASLTNAFQRVGKAFEQAHPGRKVVFNFAASGALLAQMQQGAPVDVFASADQPTMDKAVAGRLISDGTRADFVRNELVLIVPAARTDVPTQLKELEGARYRRIAAGTPASVPVGRYTMRVVEQAGLSAALQPKWIYGESVRQVLDYVARDEVDAGFVYRTDAIIRNKETRVAFAVPTQTPVSYPIAQLAASKQPATARAFIAFVRGAEGQKILQGFGFSAP